MSLISSFFLFRLIGFQLFCHARLGLHFSLVILLWLLLVFQFGFLLEFWLFLFFLLSDDSLDCQNVLDLLLYEESALVVFLAELESGQLL